MNDNRINTIVSISFAAIATIVLTWWTFHDPVDDYIVHAPGMDNRPENMNTETDQVQLGALFTSFSGKPSKLTGYWPRFRGKDFDNISKDNVKLEEKFSGGPPAVLWSIELGEGHAGPVVVDGKVYLLDYNEENHSDMLRCFSLDDGREIWQRGYSIYIKRNHGISRTVPAVAGKNVVAIGPKCHVMCVDSDSGTFKWGIDLVKDYEAEVPLWYTGQCPLITDSLAIIAVGGKALIIAVDCATGEVVWEVPNPNNWKMSHSSIMPMNINGKQLYVYCALGGIIGISADKEDAGYVVFESSLFNHAVVAPSPVYVGSGKIYVTAGYGAGSMLFQVEKNDNKYSIKELQQIKPDQGIAAEQQTPVFYNGYLFSILPKDAGPMRSQFVCSNPGDIGKIVWSSGKSKRFGLGPYIVADNKFYILSDEGVLTIIRANSVKYEELAEFKILPGHDAWGPMVIVNGRLIARDSRTMVCIDIKSRS